MKAWSCSATSAIVLTTVVGGLALAQGTSLPWGQSSDMVAWEVFVQVMAPSGNPQTTNVEFETWASDEDIYRKSPPQWPIVGTSKQLLASVLGSQRLRHGLRPLIVAPGQCTSPATPAAGGFPADGCIGEEVRRNWASFQYIVT